MVELVLVVLGSFGFPVAVALIVAKKGLVKASDVVK